MIEMRKLRELVKLMKENDLCELDIRDADEQVTLKRPAPQAEPTVVHAPPPPAAAAPAPTPAADAGPAADEGLVEIVSPMVGTFYTAANPDSEPFVRPGSRVGPDDVVCIIEAMKVFNEIKAETAGTIEKVLVTNGQAVEFGQAMFLVKPE